MRHGGVQKFEYQNLYLELISDGFTENDPFLTVDSFWSFVEGPVMSMLEADSYTGDNFSSSKEGYLYGNRRIGDIRLRQLRVTPVIRTEN